MVILGILVNIKRGANQMDSWCVDCLITVCEWKSIQTIVIFVSFEMFYHIWLS